MIVVLNNKSNLKLEEFKKYQDDLSKIKSTNQLVICPSNIYLPLVNLDNFLLGSQNVSSYKEGATTGEVAASQLKSLGVKYTIVGHSERREKLKEEGNDISKKIKQLLDNSIIPILCVGENFEQRKLGKTNEVILSTLEKSIENIESVDKIIFSYEPIWAIGTGKVPTILEIDDVISKIKEKYPNNKVLYGGSLNKDNIEEINTSNLVDGYLLGGLGLDVNGLEIFLNKIEK